MGIKNRKLWAKFNRIQINELIILAFYNLGPLIILRSILPRTGLRKNRTIASGNQLNK